MSYGGGQFALDERYRESIYTGEEPERDEAVEKLVEDYGRLIEDRYRVQSSVDGTLSMPETDRDDSLVDVEELARIDDVVAPFSRRHRGLMPVQAQRSLTPISEWEGYVESIEGEMFTVRLVNTRSGDTLPDEEAEFSTSELSGDQRKRLEVGAIVRWVVGLERLATDQRRRVSELHFRRLPAHTKLDYARAFERARDLISEIEWDDAPG